MLVGEIRSIEKCSELIGNEIRDITVCKIFPQPTTLINNNNRNNNDNNNFCVLTFVGTHVT
jgi:hypothetical protein